ncbi:MAG: 1-acyl-sn-glycerol-3-phosphate acyltransferase [Desulfobacterales bacterium]|nr:1-acyl-sn-glycerol-3-phosphate acyltransferase [Desulfobacterales bacterium]MBF0395515.1 1-acyl-sn-glycerol-3-phosphate acyltransferase [Desulfobacterales bacterium]
MIQTLLTSLWTIFATCFVAALITIFSFFTKKANIGHLIAAMWGRSILWITNIKVNVSGLSNIDPNKSYIYMPNHQSFFDIPVLFGHLRVQFRWLAKAELFKIPVFGTAMKGAGYISIDRSNKKSAKESIDKAANAIEDGVSIIIFPEGTRSKDDSIQTFKKGGFILAIDKGVPIVPVIIKGTREILARDKFIIKSGNVSFKILPPIDTSGYSLANKDELVNKVHDIMCSAYEKDY